MAGRGAPSKRTPELEEALCELIATGSSLVSACRECDVGLTTVFRWLSESPEFRDKYTRAREAQAEHYASEIVDIADEVEVQQVVTPDGVVDFKLDATAVARNKLRVDARKWVASKLLPKKYGDRVENVHTGVDGGPVDLNLKVSFVGAKRDGG